MLKIPLPNIVKQVKNEAKDAKNIRDFAQKKAVKLCPPELRRDECFRSYLDRIIATSQEIAIEEASVMGGELKVISNSPTEPPMYELVEKQVENTAKTLWKFYSKMFHLLKDLVKRCFGEKGIDVTEITKLTKKIHKAIQSGATQEKIKKMIKSYTSKYEKIMYNFSESITLSENNEEDNNNMLHKVWEVVRLIIAIIIFAAFISLIVYLLKDDPTISYGYIFKALLIKPKDVNTILKSNFKLSIVGKIIVYITIFFYYLTIFAAITSTILTLAGRKDIFKTY